uniref:Uncharacterized protein n=1 Tax=Oryza nivara TaxID=4536 RepID=A0A0E0H5X1_ORYNI
MCFPLFHQDKQEETFGVPCERSHEGRPFGGGEELRVAFRPARRRRRRAELERRGRHPVEVHPPAHGPRQLRPRRHPGPHGDPRLVHAHPRRAPGLLRALPLVPRPRRPLRRRPRRGGQGHGGLEGGPLQGGQLGREDGARGAGDQVHHALAACPGQAQGLVPPDCFFEFSSEALCEGSTTGIIISSCSVLPEQEEEAAFSKSSRGEGLKKKRMTSFKLRVCAQSNSL